MQRIIAAPLIHQNIPMIDREFDHFELNKDLEIDMRKTESATFYHDALNLEE